MRPKWDNRLLSAGFTGWPVIGGPEGLWLVILSAGRDDLARMDLTE
jgi:hypothetical protein